MSAVSKSPTARLFVLANGHPSIPRGVGVDLVVDIEGDLVHVIVPTTAPHGFRLSFTTEQVAHLVAELADACEVIAQATTFVRPPTARPAGRLFSDDEAEAILTATREGRI